MWLSHLKRSNGSHQTQYKTHTPQGNFPGPPQTSPWFSELSSCPTKLLPILLMHLACSYPRTFALVLPPPDVLLQIAPNLPSVSEDFVDHPIWSGPCICLNYITKFCCQFLFFIVGYTARTWEYHLYFTVFLSSWTREAQYWLNEWKCFPSTQICGAGDKVTYLHRPYSHQHCPLMRLFKIGRHLLQQPGHGQLPTALPVGKRVSYFILVRPSFCFSRPSPKPETQWPHYTLPFLLLLPLHQLINKSCNSPSWGGHVQYLCHWSFQLPFGKLPLPIPMTYPKLCSLDTSSQHLEGSRIMGWRGWGGGRGCTSLEVIYFDSITWEEPMVTPATKIPLTA